MLNDRNKELFKKITILEKERRELKEKLEELESDIETVTWKIAKGFEDTGGTDDLPTVSMVDEGLTASLKIENQFGVPRENKSAFIEAVKNDPVFAGLIYETWSFSKLNSHLNEMMRIDGKLPEVIESKVNSFTKYKVAFRKMTDKQKDNLRKKNIL